MPLEEVSVLGEAMTDIYVKSWIAGIDDVQETDIHYRFATILLLLLLASFHYYRLASSN